MPAQSLSQQCHLAPPTSAQHQAAPTPWAATLATQPTSTQPARSASPSTTASSSSAEPHRHQPAQVALALTCHTVTTPSHPCQPHTLVVPLSRLLRQLLFWLLVPFSCKRFAYEGVSFERETITRDRQMRRRQHEDKTGHFMYLFF